MSWLGIGNEIEDTSKGVSTITNGLRYMFTGDVDPKILAELDKIDKEHTTKRWDSDSRIKWWESSRSIVLLFLTIVYVVFMMLDTIGISINEYWVNSLTSILFIVYGAFFGGKSLELVKGVNK